MYVIIKCIAVCAAALAPTFAHAHVGTIAHDAFQHGVAHALEIMAVVLVGYLGYRGWRRFCRH